MNETAVLFGRRRSLVGIVTDPEPTPPAEPRTAVVLLNAGIIHRVGPGRLHVRLARALAQLGFTAFRFDLSGIGDSPRGDSTEAYTVAAAREVREGFDLLQSTRGVSRFVVMGICSGADNGLRVALQDERVVGAVLIDGYNVPGFAHFLRLYRGKLASPRGWVRLLSGRSEAWSRLGSLVKARVEDVETGTFVGSAMPGGAEYVRQVRSVADRGIHVLLAYTAESPAWINYRRLLRRSLRSWPSRDRVQVDYFADADHVFTLLTCQQRLVERLCAWSASLPSGRSADRATR